MTGDIPQVSETENEALTVVFVEKEVREAIFQQVREAIFQQGINTFTKVAK